MRKLKIIAVALACCVTWNATSLATTFVSGTSVQAVNVDSYAIPKIVIFGKEYVFNKDYYGVLRNDRIMVPLNCDIFTAVDSATYYDFIYREITVKGNGHAVSSYLQELDWYDNGIRSYICDVRSDTIDGEVYVPLRAILECLGFTVDYDHNGGTPTATVTK